MRLQRVSGSVDEAPGGHAVVNRFRMRARGTRVPHRTGPPLLLLGLVLVVAVLAPGCRAGHAASSSDTELPLPTWIGRVVPAPGASDGGAHAVEVRDKLRSEEHTSELQSRGHLVC